jgi:hypothetical protein
MMLDFISQSQLFQLNCMTNVFVKIQGEIVKSRSSERSQGRSSYQTDDMKVSSTTDVNPTTPVRETVWTTNQSYHVSGGFSDFDSHRDGTTGPVQRKNRLAVPVNIIHHQDSPLGQTNGLRFNRFSSFRNSFNSMTNNRNKKKKKPGRTAPREETIPFQLNSVSQIDKFCRVVFPLTFIIVNYFYWNNYLHDEEDD